MNIPPNSSPELSHISFSKKYHLWREKRKAKALLKRANHAYIHLEKLVKNNGSTYSALLEEIRSSIQKLDMALQSNDIHLRRETVPQLKESLKKVPGKSFLRLCFDFCIALIIAVALAGVIRQVWFELYEIPTGSMRPTFKEQDRVLVSKTSFGINIPFYTDQLLFSPNTIQRGTITVITGDGVDLPDVNTLYFGLFPGKRRYVKRIVALPGDRVYFYGGDIFCLDKDNKTIHHLKQDPLFSHLEYLPFIHFEGKIELMRGSRFGRQKTIEIKQMNIPIAKIEYAPNGSITSFIKENARENRWISQFSDDVDRSKLTPQTIGDFWGIKNFAKAKMILPEDLPIQSVKMGYNDKEALAWLELSHSPTLPQLSSEEAVHQAAPHPILLVKSWIPLHEEQLDRMMNGLYTARFVVKNGYIHRYHYEGVYKEVNIRPLKPISDGTYEFYHGKAYSISSLGTATELSDTDSIYPKTVKELLFWYNIGIDMHEEMLSKSHTSPIPNRYAYFRDGDFLTMGVVIIDRDDPILQQFIENEITRQARDYSYFAFHDYGSPLNDPDPQFFQVYGLQIPEKQYLLLGDNHAMSIDSRYFGTIPQENLQGSPVLLFWPFGPRWGAPLQPSTGISIYSICLLLVIGSTIFFFVTKKKSEDRGK